MDSKQVYLQFNYLTRIIFFLILKKFFLLNQTDSYSKYHFDSLKMFFFFNFFFSSLVLIIHYLPFRQKIYLCTVYIVRILVHLYRNSTNVIANMSLIFIFLCRITPVLQLLLKIKEYFVLFYF